MDEDRGCRRRTLTQFLFTVNGRSRGCSITTYVIPHVSACVYDYVHSPQPRCCSQRPRGTAATESVGCVPTKRHKTSILSTRSSELVRRDQGPPFLPKNWNK